VRIVRVCAPGIGLGLLGFKYDDRDFLRHLTAILCRIAVSPYVLLACKAILFVVVAPIVLPHIMGKALSCLLGFLDCVHILWQ
jgi:hypothetical protein